MDLTILCIIAAAIILAITVILFFLKRTADDGSTAKPQRADNILPGARRRQLGQNRNLRQRTRQREEEDEEQADEDELDIQLPEGKVGAKKLAKLQAKAEKKAQREVEERDRQERKKKLERNEEVRKKQEEKEKEAEKKKEEEERKVREEKERQEHEEYLKLKEAFSVEQEGYEEGEEEGSSLQDFVNHIKKTKVVVIEDIAAIFKLKAQQAIERIQQMQADGIISGVIDDRGKFIYISREELESIAKFVKQRGRVSIAELVENSNMLIDLTPTLTTT